jgi:hypothetical protein
LLFFIFLIAKGIEGRVICLVAFCINVSINSHHFFKIFDALIFNLKTFGKITFKSFLKHRLICENAQL